jgi:ankyrin repeat protein
MSWSGLVYSNRLQYGHPPLHNACWRGHVDVVSLLLAAGAPLEAIDEVLYEFVWLAEESF